MGLTIYLWWCAAFLLPHGDLHQQIIDLSKTITQFPDSTGLYMERGELYLLHDEADVARADFLRCIHSGLLTSRVFLGYSKSLFYSGLPDSVLYYVDLALEKDETDTYALEWKGFVLLRLEKYCESAEMYGHVISLARQPSPSLFIDASYAWLNCPEADSRGKASRVLNEGMNRLGRLHVLEKALVGVYLHDEEYEEALRVQTDIIEHWVVKTKPYYDRAEIYLLMGEKDAAIEDLHKALYSIDSMPGYKSTTPAMTDMRSKIVSLLNRAGS